MTATQTGSQITVCALYQFVRLENFQLLQKPLLDELKRLEIHGTLLLAYEGINGTIAGSQTSIETILQWLNNIPEFNDVEYKLSYTDIMPFKRIKVKLKKEIVTMGVQGIDPNQSVGTYLNAQEWNDLLEDPEVILIDTRNDYEYQVGTFENAINPNTESFREFPQYVQEHFDPDKHKKIAMFCTGGIRCEKSTAFMKELGFEEVYHLKGGILKYFEEMPEDKTRWQGECFVFDDRVTVNHQLERGGYDQCHACRLPITDEDKLSAHYEKGVSCPHCFDKHTAEQKARFAEREKQMQLAAQRGESHIGSDITDRIAAGREAKRAAKEKQRALDRGE